MTTISLTLASHSFGKGLRIFFNESGSDLQETDVYWMAFVHIHMQYNVS
jgi:hypothetical protein